MSKQTPPVASGQLPVTVMNEQQSSSQKQFWKCKGRLNSWQGGSDVTLEILEIVSGSKPPAFVISKQGNKFGHVVCGYPPGFTDSNNWVLVDRDAKPGELVVVSLVSASRQNGSGKNELETGYFDLRVKDKVYQPFR